jgi:hypothetical protein
MVLPPSENNWHYGVCAKQTPHFFTWPHPPPTPTSVLDFLATVSQTARHRRRPIPAVSWCRATTALEPPQPSILIPWRGSLDLQPFTNPTLGPARFGFWDVASASSGCGAGALGHPWRLEHPRAPASSPTASQAVDSPPAGLVAQARFLRGRQPVDAPSRGGGQGGAGCGELRAGVSIYKPRELLTPPAPSPLPSRMAGHASRSSSRTHSLH